MKKQILFVDDDAFILSALRRLLRRTRDEWEVEFAANGKEAIAHLGSNPVDVIVTDVRMPVMDGFELLDHVRVHYPDMVRIILSGQTDSDTHLRAVGPTHHCLSKPCQPGQLQQVIQTAFRLQDHLQQQTSDEFPRLNELRVKEFPFLPCLMNELRSADGQDLEVIQNIVERDAMMSLRLLMEANDRPSRSMGASTISDAIKLLGPRKSLEVLLADTDQQIAINEVEHQRINNSSLEYSREFYRQAERLDATASESNDSRLAGMGLVIGQLAIKMLSQTAALTISDTWVNAVSSLFLQKWGFSNGIAEAVAFFDSDEKPIAVESKTPLTVIREYQNTSKVVAG